MKKIFFIYLMLMSFVEVRADDKFPSDKMCVLIYFDEVKSQSYYEGKKYSIKLQNLLGHFPEIQQIVSPIEKYRKGDLDRCRAGIYIGSYFDNIIPVDFLSDYVETTSRVAWLGYNVWKLSPEQQSKAWGYQYNSLTKIDKSVITKDGLPAFFRFFKYKGETFKKFANWVSNEHGDYFAASYEMTRMEPVAGESEKANVLSMAEHSLTREQIPYIIEKNNKFYVGDTPFSYLHESDRYLIFSDLLFDILDLPPRHKVRPALIRLEDVHPMSDLWELYNVTDIFNSENVPMHISLIPVFYDPLENYGVPTHRKIIEIADNPEFLKWLEMVKTQDTFFIWHGVTHQYGNVKNPHTGYTSDDFEFWDMVNNTPISEDSANYVLDKLEWGAKVLAEVDIFPRVWLTPHYQASALDYRIFSKVFEWNIGRVIYFVDKPNRTLSEMDSESLLYSYNLNNKIRENYFSNYSTQTASTWFGQLYPYEIYGDVYGQRVIPEVLGNPQPFVSEHVIYPRSIDEIIADAKRNLVIRDAWASLFVHPYLLVSKESGGLGEFDGDPNPYLKLIREIKSMGYEFKNLNEFINKTKGIQNARKAIEL